MDKRIAETLSEASSILLGHLRLGQATSTLSGGENIRIKILKASKTTAAILGIDELFKGLSSSEVFWAASFFEQIRLRGKTIIVIDHSPIAEQYFGWKIR